MNMNMNNDICFIIAKYVNEKYKLLDWININRLNNNNLSLNKNAIELLKENKDKIVWWIFSQNPNIFTYDYKLMKENMKKSGIVEELMSVIFHPKNMNKWINWGFEEHEEMLNFIN